MITLEGTYMSVFRWRWWRIGIADPNKYKQINGWTWVGGHIWWKKNSKQTGS